MADPYSWRIDDIERKANAAAPRHEVDALRGEVARLERALGEVRSERDELRNWCAGLQARLEAIEAEPSDIQRSSSDSPTKETGSD